MPQRRTPHDRKTWLLAAALAIAIASTLLLIAGLGNVAELAAIAASGGAR